MTSAVEAPSALAKADALEDFGKLNIGVERATAVANQLKPIVDSQKLAVRIGQGEHLKVEAWVTLGMFCGVTPQTEWTQEVRNPKSGELEGYKARVQVIRMATGEPIGAAECGCHFDEQQKRRDGSGLYDRWMEHGRQNRHACMSMAQTRATSKALAQALRWIPVLAGYSGTPFEEMPPDASQEGRPPQRSKGKTSQEGDVKLASEKQVGMLKAKSYSRAEELGEAGDYENIHEYAAAIRRVAMDVLGFEDVSAVTFAGVTPMAKAIEAAVLDDKGKATLPDGGTF